MYSPSELSSALQAPTRKADIPQIIRRDR